MPLLIIQLSTRALVEILEDLPESMTLFIALKSVPNTSINLKLSTIIDHHWFWLVLKCLFRAHWLQPRHRDGGSALSSTERVLRCVLFRRWHYYSYRYKTHTRNSEPPRQVDIQTNTLDIFSNPLCRRLSKFASGLCITLLQMRLITKPIPVFTVKL